jgi:hypothetical protein
MLFKNGEMIVSGYQLHSAVSVGTNMDLTSLSKMANPLPTRFRYLRANIAKAQNNPSMVIISTLPRHYGSVQPKIQRKYDKAILNIRRALYWGSPDDIAAFRNRHIPFTFCMIEMQDALNKFAQRALQVLNFHAHTIQLLFRRNVERKRKTRALVIHYLLEQQKQIRYLQNEYVLRNILSFSK